MPPAPKTAINGLQSKRFARCGGVCASRNFWAAGGFSTAIQTRRSLTRFLDSIRNICSLCLRTAIRGREKI